MEGAEMEGAEMERAERVVAAMVTVERKNVEMALSPEPAVQRVVAVLARLVVLVDPVVANRHVVATKMGFGHVERTKSWRGAPHKGFPPMCGAVSSSKQFVLPV